MSSGTTFDIGIQAIAYRLGSRAETGADLVRANPDWRIEDIEAKTGVMTRHIAAPGETASDMAANAAMELFERGVDRAEIGALLFVTQSPDYYLPTTACLLQDRLGLSKSCLAFDINQGCSGFVYGLGVATSLINAGFAKSVLLLCGDTYTRYINENDRTCRPIFSDGAAATLIGKSTEAAIGPFVFGSDGSGGPNLIVKGGGAREAGLDAGGPSPQLYMNGPPIFTFTMSAVPKLVASLLDAGNTRMEEVDLFVFHQASALVLENLARKLKLPPNKMYSNLSRTGNTVSATIPIALAEAAREGRIYPGQTVLICGFGVGYSWAGALLKWSALAA